MGIGGQIEFSIQGTKATDGTAVPLEFTKETHNGSTIISAILTVVCCICFIIIPGKNVTVEKGTVYSAKVPSSIDVKSK